MAFTTILGYKLFAGKFGLIGIPVSILCMASMVYLINRLDFAFFLSGYFYGSFDHVFEYFQIMNDFLANQDPEVSRAYTTNLIQLMFFTLATGIIGTVAAFISEKKAKPSYPILDVTEDYNMSF